MTTSDEFCTSCHAMESYIAASEAYKGSVHRITASGVRDWFRANDSGTCRSCHEEARETGMTCIHCHDNLVHEDIEPSQSVLDSAGGTK